METRGQVAPLVDWLIGAGSARTHGSIAAILSAAPHASVELWNAVKACTRYAQSLQELSTTLSRAPMPEASLAQQAAIRQALEGLGASHRQTEAASNSAGRNIPALYPRFPPATVLLRTGSVGMSSNSKKQKPR
jgi:hypothetical protein